jgi:hypothetical protein
VLDLARVTRIHWMQLDLEHRREGLEGAQLANPASSRGIA